MCVVDIVENVFWMFSDEVGGKYDSKRISGNIAERRLLFVFSSYSVEVDIVVDIRVVKNEKGVGSVVDLSNEFKFLKLGLTGVVLDTPVTAEVGNQIGMEHGVRHIFSSKFLKFKKLTGVGMFVRLECR